MVRASSDSISTGFRFLRKYRILHSAEFDQVFSKKCSVSDNLLILYVGKNNSGLPRLGLVVSKKIGGAVERNRWKRLLREAFRLERENLPASLDLVILPRKGSKPSLGTLRASITRLAARGSDRLERQR